MILERLKQHHAALARQFRAKKEHQNFMSFLEINANKSMSFFRASSEKSILGVCKHKQLSYLLSVTQPDFHLGSVTWSKFVMDGMILEEHKSKPRINSGR